MATWIMILDIGKRLGIHRLRDEIQVGKRIANIPSRFQQSAAQPA